MLNHNKISGRLPSELNSLRRNIVRHLKRRTNWYTALFFILGFFVWTQAMSGVMNNKPASYYFVGAFIAWAVPLLLTLILGKIIKEPAGSKFSTFIGLFLVALTVGLPILVVPSNRKNFIESGGKYLVWNPKNSNVEFTDKYPKFKHYLRVERVRMSRNVKSVAVLISGTYEYMLSLDMHFTMSHTQNNAEVLLSYYQANERTDFGEAELLLTVEIDLRKLGLKLLETRINDLKACQLPEISIRPITSVQPEVFKIDFDRIHISGIVEKKIVLAD